jgi:hypothetical protein
MRWPALTRPNVTNVAGPFLARAFRCKIAIRQVWRYIEFMITVRRDLVCAGSNNGNAALVHQAAQTRMGLFFDVRQRDQTGSLPAARWATAVCPQTSHATAPQYYLRHAGHPARSGYSLQMNNAFGLPG